MIPREVPETQQQLKKFRHMMKQINGFLSACEQMVKNCKPCKADGVSTFVQKTRAQGAELLQDRASKRAQAQVSHAKRRAQLTQRQQEEDVRQHATQQRMDEVDDGEDVEDIEDVEMAEEQAEPSIEAEEISGSRATVQAEEMEPRYPLRSHQKAPKEQQPDVLQEPQQQPDVLQEPQQQPDVPQEPQQQPDVSDTTPSDSPIPQHQSHQQFHPDVDSASSSPVEKRPKMQDEACEEDLAVPISVHPSISHFVSHHMCSTSPKKSPAQLEFAILTRSQALNDINECDARVSELQQAASRPDASKDLVEVTKRATLSKSIRQKRCEIGLGMSKTQLKSQIERLVDCYNKCRGTEPLVFDGNDVLSAKDRRKRELKQRQDRQQIQQQFPLLAKHVQTHGATGLNTLLVSVGLDVSENVLHGLLALLDEC